MCTALLPPDGPGSVVGIATGYGMDGLGSNPGGKQRPGREADPHPLLVPWS